MKLYELSQAQEQYRNSIERLILDMTDPDTGEFLASDESVEAMMTLSDLAQMTEADLDSKAETIGLFIIDLDAEADAIKEQEAKLAKRRKTIEKKSAWMRAYLSQNIAGRKIKTPRVTINWRKSSAVEVDSEFLAWARENGDQYLRYKDPEVNKTAIKDAIRAGTEVPHASIVERETILIK